jgi:transcriptional regulator with GAF, ATPase, and Fis domain
LTRPYPGNVRELRQLVSRISQRHVGGGPLTLGDVPEDDRPRERSARTDWRDDGLEEVIRRALILGAGLREISHAAAEAAIRLAISEANGNLQRAAQRLGVTDRALQMRRANDRRSTR